MSGRYLTVEDVHRHGGPEIVVEEGTVVTRQALDAADRLGIAIRTPGGAYAEPEPDRGPDAAYAARTLPNLPEPSDTPDSSTGVVVTVVGRNRPNVLAEITGAIGRFCGNVRDISQKEIEGYFHLILTLELPPDGSFHDFKTTLECLGGPEDYVVRVMHERVFRFMHRI